MATPTFSINGGTAIHGVEANWQRVVKRKNTDGSIDYQPWAEHTWAIRSMEMSAYLALQALAGQVLTSLATTDIDLRNSAQTYTDAELTGLSARHTGRRATGVRVEFRVGVASGGLGAFDSGFSTGFET